MTTKVSNIRDGIPPNSVYIGRAGRGFDGKWGNPFAIGSRSREEALSLYREWFHSRVAYDKNFRNDVIRELDGKTLLCFCKPLACHGDIIVEFLEGGRSA